MKNSTPKTNRVVARLSDSDYKKFLAKIYPNTAFSQQYVIEKLIIQWMNGEIKV